MATNIVVRNVDEKIALALKLKQQAASYSNSVKAEHREIFEISKQVGLDLAAQHLTAHQFKWIDMIGIVGLMKQAQPTDLVCAVMTCTCAGPYSLFRLHGAMWQSAHCARSAASLKLADSSTSYQPK